MVGMDKILRERLSLIFDWYSGMVKEQTGRLVYLYDPVTNTFTADESPIRDIASVWDMDVTGHFVNGMIKSLKNWIVC